MQNHNNGMELKVKKRTYELRQGNVVYDVESVVPEESDAEAGLKEFATNYRIVACRHVTSPAEEHVAQRPRSQVKLANPPTPIQREYSILNKMPEVFSLKDYVEYWLEKDNYDTMQLKKSFSYPIKQLKEQGFVEVVNPDEQTHERKYKIVAEKGVIDEFLKSIRDGQKVLMGTIQ